MTNAGSITDGVIIEGTRFKLTNSDSGRIAGGLTFAQGGNSLVNQLGGVVRGPSVPAGQKSVAITGSIGADTVINAGLIAGYVSLGDGADTFIDRGGTVSVEPVTGATLPPIDFGAGDDTYRVEGSNFLFLNAAGGAGRDRVVIANTNFQIDGGSLSQFEDVVFEKGGNLQRFSGYQSMVLVGTDFFNFLDSYNPLIDLSLSSQSAAARRSLFRSVVGSEGKDAFELGGGGTILTDVRLGAGDDWMTLSTLPDTPIGILGGVADAGSGKDTLELRVGTGTDVAFDLSKYVGFEALWSNSSYVASVVSRVSHASGFTDIRIGQKGTLILSASDLPNANVMGGLGGSFTLEQDARIARYGMPLEPAWDQRTDIAQGDDQLSAKLINRGTITGEVKFYIGDDLYDGRVGSVGGTVYGNAGNDTLLGGAGAERFEGGYGADYLLGGAGNDSLYGDAGNDVLDGGVGNDRLFGGDGDDVLRFASGRDVVDGGAGTDTLELAGAQSTYRVAQAGDALVFTHGQDSVQVTGIEQVRFGEGASRALADVVASTTAFDGLSYIASYADLRQAFGVDAARGVEHFARWGAAEGRSATFNSYAYLASYADLRAAFGADEAAGARHYIQWGLSEGRGVTFSAIGYLASYADLRAVYGTDEVAAAGHYVKWGLAEGRSVTFDAFGYLASNPAVLQAVGANITAAATHYVTIGAAQGLTTTGFAALSYIASSGDLIHAFGVDTAAGTRHYVEWGAAEHRIITFDPLAYAAQYSDLQQAFGTDKDALARHYIQWGYAEGRSPGAPLSAAAFVTDDHSHLGASGNELLAAPVDPSAHVLAGVEFVI